MIVFKIVLALLSLGAFCVLFHYLNWEIHNGEFDAKWRNHKAYVLFLLFGFILVAYGGAMNIMFFIPDSWFDDEYGDATGVKEGIAGMVAFGSLVLLDSFKKLSESSANEVYLKNELEKTKQNYLEDISRMNSDHNAKYTEIENETLELKKDLEFKTKKCEFLPGLYHDTKAFHIQEISHINQISNTWTIINREFTEKSLSDLSAKTANLLSTGKLNRDKTTRNLRPLLQSCKDINCGEHDEVYACAYKHSDRYSHGEHDELYACVNKTPHPYSDKIFVNESMLGLVEAFYIICLFPYDLYQHVNGDRKGRCVVSEDDAMQYYILAQRLKLSLDRASVFDRVWGLRVKKQSNGTIALKCLMKHETFTQQFLSDGELEIKQGQISLRRMVPVGNPVTTVYVS